MTRLRATSESGLTLVEVIVALLVATIAVGSTMTALASNKRSEAESERTEVAARLAENMIEELKSRSYNSLAMQGSPSATWVPPGASDRFDSATAPSKLRVGSPPELEPFVTAATGIPVGPQQRDSIEATTSSRSPTRFNVWTYVTWRDERCFYPDRCATPNDTKRVTVALQPLRPFPGNNQPRRVQWFSDIVVDETKTTPTQDCNGPDCTSTANQTQPFYLYDLSCKTDDVLDHRVTQQDHVARSTGAFTANDPAKSSYCWNGASDPSGRPYAPDLMGAGIPRQPPTGNVDWPARNNRATDLRYSPTTYGFGKAGIPIKRSNGCQTSYPGGEAPWTVRTWSTKPFDAPLTVKGYFSMDMYAGTFATGTPGANPGFRGTVCISLISRKEVASSHSTDTLLYSFPCAIRPWPRGTPEPGNPLPDGMVGGYLSGGTACSYNPQKNQANGNGAIQWPESGYTIPAGNRLVFRLSVCGSNCGTQASDNDLVFFYDDPRFWSSIKLSTDRLLPDDHIQ